jgi:hypothetical protein
MSDVRPASKMGFSPCVGDDPNRSRNVSSIEAKAYILGFGIDTQAAPIFHEGDFDIEKILKESDTSDQQDALKWQHQQWLAKELEEEKSKEELDWPKETLKIAADKKYSKNNFSGWKSKLPIRKISLQFGFASGIVPFASFSLTILLIIGIFSFISKGMSIKGQVLGASQDGYDNVTAAINDMTHQNFEGSTEQFALAIQNFDQASQNMQEIGGSLLDVTRFIPLASKLSSGENAVQAGKHFSLAGQSLSEVAKIFVQIKNPLDGQSQPGSQSLLELFQGAQKNITTAKTELDRAQQNLDYISVDDLPKDKQDKFVLLKEQLPEIRSALGAFLDNSNIFVDLLGGNGPRKYLFLFQNNSEMRATGGFIGSYGLLDIQDGNVKQFFINGIFDPDGQLQKKIVPPSPIQKISAAWSMHDSNWFPDFPTSAQKAVQFYEMTGGPTADGVIAITPTIMQKLLDITGPINMPAYGVTLDSQNFLDLTQYQVEDNYDKTENQPKKILSDLAPIVLGKILANRDPQTLAKTAQALLAGLQEKHILLYSQNPDLEKIISNQGWSGEILPSQKDYISVINTNINGFKTDAVIDEKIAHQAEIQSDGSIVDTVTITRHHNGGNTPYDWLNKVNADYMRVYVPQGSKLLSVSGQTRETDKPPLDYTALGFQRDTDVQKEEDTATIDSDSGTAIYDEDGKTVFANWTYVSPQETMTITYKYLLPFRMFQITNGSGPQFDSYSLVAQKQSGSVGSVFSSSVSYPQNYSSKWKFPSDAQDSDNVISEDSKLDVDRYVGIAFERN